MYRFLASRQWLGWLALVLVLAAACAALGSWQMDRRNAAVAEVEQIQQTYDADPVPFTDARGYFEAFDPDAEWLPVTLHGTYDTANTRIVRNRPLNGRPGYEVLVPLRLEDGAAVIINRGWLPIGNNQAGRPDEVPEPPAGDVTVTARIKPGEPQLNRSAPAGQLASIHLQTYAAALDYPTYTDSYAIMAAETPAPASTPVPVGKPAIDTGPHLSYSLQWFAFGVLAFVGLGYAARQQARLNQAEKMPADAEEAGQPQEPGQDASLPQHGPGQEPAEPKGKVTTAPGGGKRRRRRTAEEEEDALLDAQGYR